MPASTAPSCARRQSIDELAITMGLLDEIGIGRFASSATRSAVVAASLAAPTRTVLAVIAAPTMDAPLPTPARWRAMSTPR